MFPLWADVVLRVLVKFLSAKTTSALFDALKLKHRIKCTLVRPLRGGAQRRGQNYRFRKKMFLFCASEKIDDAWDFACNLEARRKKKSNPDKAKSQLENKNSEKRKLRGLQRRAISLAKLGESGSAVKLFLSKGVADLECDIVDQLRMKHPHRVIPSPMPRPTPEEI